MGIVWEAYHKQVPLLGVPENPIDTYIYIFIYTEKAYIYIYTKGTMLILNRKIEAV